jgi:hypothetical protein
MHTHLEALKEQVVTTAPYQPRDDATTIQHAQQASSSDPTLPQPVQTAATLSPPAAQGMNDLSADLNQAGIHTVGVSPVVIDRFLISHPTNLQGTRCYIDASTHPDQLNPRLDLAYLLFTLSVNLLKVSSLEH